MPSPIKTYSFTPNPFFVELYLSDVHVPYHDKDAWALTLAISETLQPDLIYVGGDFVDLYPISDFDRDPVRANTLQVEFDQAIRCLKELWATCPTADRVFHEGNHETRMKRHLWKKDPSLASLRSLVIPAQLELKEMGCEFIPNGTLYKIGELYHAHGNEFSKSGGQYPARTVFYKALLNIIFGHYHRLGVYFENNPKQKVWGSFSNGCLCDLHPDYVAFPNWQQSVTVVTYTAHGFYHVDQIPFFRNKKNKLCCLLDGELLAV